MKGCTGVIFNKERVLVLCLDSLQRRVEFFILLEILLDLGLDLLVLLDLLVFPSGVGLYLKDALVADGFI